MKKVKIGGIVLVLLLVLLNPSVKAHRDAFGEVLISRFSAHMLNGSWWDKLNYWYGGEDGVKRCCKVVTDRLYRKNFVIFSLGYFDRELVTLGVFGWVYVFDFE